MVSALGAHVLASLIEVRHGYEAILASAPIVLVPAVIGALIGFNTGEGVDIGGGDLDRASWGFFLGALLGAFIVTGTFA